MAESIPNLAKEPVKQVQEALSLKQDVRKETIMKTHNKTSNYPTGLMAKKKTKHKKQNINKRSGFPGGSVVKNPPANAGNMGLIPGAGRESLIP